MGNALYLIYGQIRLIYDAGNAIFALLFFNEFNLDVLQ
jgi:hypothetical protein